MRNVIYKDFRDSLAKLNERGGRYQKIAGKVFQVIGKTDIFKDKDTFDSLPVTNHGESRIKHCVIDAVLMEIESGQGAKYDPDVVQACKRLFEEKKFAYPSN